MTLQPYEGKIPIIELSGNSGSSLSTIKENGWEGLSIHAPDYLLTPPARA